MEIKTNAGIMKVVRDNNTTLEKEKIKLKGLEELIKEDKKNNDAKSLKYHTLALEETNKIIKELEGNLEKWQELLV